jgi:hypothetical protein
MNNSRVDGVLFAGSLRKNNFFIGWSFFQSNGENNEKTNSILKVNLDRYIRAVKSDEREKRGREAPHETHETCYTN